MSESRKEMLASENELINAYAYSRKRAAPHRLRPQSAPTLPPADRRRRGATVASGATLQFKLGEAGDAAGRLCHKRARAWGQEGGGGG